MIVDPDFFDHWRTRMVADMLGDAMAPVYIMRLWAHCQNRKGDVFDIPPAGIKALCSFAGDAQALEDALIAAEYMSRDGKTVTVIGWAEKNASLLSAWANGVKGGRPKKNPNETQNEPTENPEITHGLPVGNPPLTETKPIREDKRREEKKNTPHSPPAGGGEDASFAAFWSCWPENERRQDKAKCMAKWDRDRLGVLADQIFADVEAKKCSDKWRAGYVESPLVYLNNRRWEDGAVVAKTKSLNRNSDEYADAHKSAAWWRDAGFPSVWAAIASRCWHDNADQFHDGQRVEVAV